MAPLYFQHNAFAAANEIGSPMLISDSKGLVVRPIPRRPGVPMNDLIMSPRGQMRNSNQCEYDSVAELPDGVLMGRRLQIIRSPSSPYFYSGSPPVRSTNPLIQDNRFSNGIPVAKSDLSAVQKGDCGKINSVASPAPIRVVGFSCSSQNSRISTIS